MNDMIENDEKKDRKNFQFRNVVHCVLCGRPILFSESIKCPFCSRLCCSDCVKLYTDGDIQRQVCKVCYKERFTVGGIVNKRWKETLILAVLLILWLYFILKSGRLVG